MIRNVFLVLEAKSFYNAYIALEQIHLSCEDKIIYYAPLVVNGAFSIELSMKAILAENQIDYGKEHNLLVLFQLLPEAFQLELLGYLVKKAPEYKETKTLCEELLLISNAFVDWRYAFEDNPAPALNTRFVSAFANAAICTMLAHYNVSATPVPDEAKTAEERSEEIEEKFRRNRENCMKANLEIIQKKSKRNQPEAPNQVSGSNN